ncbi:MAG TPA: hypothetical protein EYP98_20400, partial [Planctomycetes bacterium]|nr:hypothetical protein [Planctomycetota bacterium]
MKIVSLLGGVLPLLVLAACGGGDAPNKSKSGSPTTASTGAPNTGSANTAGKPDGSAQSGGSIKPEGAQNPKPAGSKPKKLVRRPRINVMVVKALLGNDPAAPKAEVASTPALVALGRALFHSEHLSQKGNISCASCHDLSTYGVDNKPTSPGSTGENGVRNTPTVYNAARQFRQFWDGRAESVEEQAIMPVLNPIEHGLADEAAVLAKILKEDTVKALESGKRKFEDYDIPGADMDKLKLHLKDEADRDIFEIHKLFASKVLAFEVGHNGVLLNGRVLGPLTEDDEFGSDDFNLLDKFSTGHFGEKLINAFYTHMDVKAEGISDLAMKLSSLLISRPESSKSR